ncbi:UDP-glucose 4-epimerase [uncultured Defluviicoccus sp.]|uniref:UDP-glucose 4-epimerase n=1 Tax=metagenome TaxID=256318 RepID=A0A380TEA6_9ZZZZ|nr:UDP-glucose 4-epimerase [uncultured Defluviicoccus sp.]
MATLVTGGAGYIGSHVAWALRGRGDEVVVLDSLVTGFEAAVPCDVRFVKADIGDEKALRRVFAETKIDTVVHFAGSTVVPESVENPLKYYSNNTIKAYTLISASVAANVRQFVFSSTAAVYGMTGAEPVSETAPVSPESPYGASKLMTERMLWDVSSAHGMSVAVLRYFNVAGADPEGRTGQSTRNATHLIKVCVRAALGLNDGVTVFGTDYPTSDGTGERDYIHVSDLADAHLAVIDHLRGHPGQLLVNCGYGHGFSVLEVIEAVTRISGKDFPVRIASRRPGDLSSVIANSTKLRNEVGWKPRFDDLDAIVTHALAWERQLCAQ